MSLLKFTQRSSLAAVLLPKMCWQSLTLIIAAITTFPQNHDLKWWICCHLCDNVIHKDLPSSPSLLSGLILLMWGVDFDDAVHKLFKGHTQKKKEVQE